MLEQPSTLHATLLPITVIAVSVAPTHFTTLVIATIFEVSLVHELVGHCQFTLTVFPVSIPKSLNLQRVTS